MYTLTATFTFSTFENKKKFLGILKSPDGLAVTRVWPGCELIECYTVQGNDYQVFLWEKWDTKNSHEKYMKMRKDTGMFTLLESMLEKPFEVVALNEEVALNSSSQNSSSHTSMYDPL